MPLRGSWNRGSSTGLAATACLALCVLAVTHCGGSEDSGSGAAADGGADGAAASDSGPDARADSGADGDVPAPPTEGSGKRFGVTGADLTFEDGAKLRSTGVGVTFLDRALSNLCRIEEVAPNQYVCLPTDRDDVEADTFADAACTMPILGVRGIDPTFGAPKYVRWGRPCAWKIGSFGAVLATNGSTYRKDRVTQECRFFESGVALIAPPPEIPFSDFGEFTRTADTVPFPGERSGTRLSVMADRFTGPDGSFERRTPRVVDLARKSTGTFGVGVDKRRYFFTSSGLTNETTITYSDDACTQGVVTFEKEYPVCHADTYRAVDGVTRQTSTDGTCTATGAFARPAGGPLTDLFEVSGAACKARLRSPPAGLDLYVSQPLSPVSLQALVEVTSKVVPTNVKAVSGSLLEARAASYSSADGLELRERKAKMFLRKYDVPCEPAVLAGDSKERCVPQVLPYGEVGVLFADAACSQRVVRIYGSLACDQALSTPLVKFNEPGVGMRIARRPSPSAPPSLYKKDMTSACVPTTDAPNDHVLFTNLEVLPLTDFPRLTLRKGYVE